MEDSKSAPEFAQCKTENVAHGISIKQALNTFTIVVVNGN
jgi:hypothetical protein